MITLTSVITNKLGPTHHKSHRHPRRLRMGAAGCVARATCLLVFAGYLSNTKTFTNLAEHVCFFSNSWPYEGTTDWIEVINKPNPVEPFSVNLHILVHPRPLKNNPIPDLCHIPTLKPLRNTVDFFCTHSLTSFVTAQSPQFVAAIFAAARPSEAQRWYTPEREPDNNAGGVPDEEVSPGLTD